MIKHFRKSGAILIIAFIVFFGSCRNIGNNNSDDPKTPEESLFTGAPALEISSANGYLRYIIADSDPHAEIYDIYWEKGKADAAALKSEGTLIANSPPCGLINGLENGGIYSMLITAKSEGYASMDSAVITGVPGNKPSPKRGVGYNFNFPRPGNGNSGPGHNNPAIIAADMDLLGPGTAWWYNWGADPGDPMGTVADQKEMPFVPMIWGGGSQTASLNTVSAYVSSHPDVTYVLAYNEPNLTDQANLTPAQAASLWPSLKKQAKELGLKIVSPAMNYGTLTGYSDPVKWLEEFFGTDGNPGFEGVSLDDIDAIAVHLYNDFGNNVRTYIDKFRKFGKPIWLTEFCAWNDKSGVYFTSPDFQIGFMSQAIVYLELDPIVERYAWFIPKGGTFDSEDSFPWNKLLSAPPPPALPSLTGIGQVFVSMSTCDKSVYYIPGELIAAKDFSTSNISELAPENPYVVNAKAWQDGVKFRTSTDTAQEAAPLDIEFSKPANNPGNMWVEYQVYAPETRQYTLTLRYTASENSSMTIRVDGDLSGSTWLYTSDQWADKTAAIVMSAGKHTIRFIITGTCALNRLKIE